MYYCGQDSHIHGDGCYDETGGLICEQAEHAHEDACLIEPPVYSCGQEVHIHEENCYDETGELICQQPEHEHTEACQAEPKPVYYCGQEIHIHEETCYDEAGKLICEKPVHDHTEECLIRYYCGKETHIHDAKACHDAEGNLICEKTEHTHAERCRYPPMMSTGPIFYCGLEMHTHEDTCYDIAQNLTCQLQEHTHDDSCLIKPPEYLCGAQEHTHSDVCKDVAGGLICGQEEHTHSSLCLADLSALDADARQQVEKVILMIDEIPSADEIDGKIAEFEAAEDYAGEEAWLTETYQKVGNAYAAYISLPENLQARVVNRDKLLKLDYIWSVMPLNTYYVWLDGTNGSMMSLAGSDNTRYILNTPGRDPYAFTLPTAWKSPAKYSYTLRGWYDIHNKQYYQPGDTVDIYQNTVFYADWEAATYNVGQFDAHVVDTVSTNDFVTTRLFDYSGIFNMYSSRMNSSSVGQNSHSESWEVVSKGTNGSHGIILRDWDTGGPRQNSWPSNAADHNTSQDTVTFGLYNAYNMYDLFFNPSASYMGKEYLGTADHLFQYEKDPNSPYYGYYYYDSARNAASYNQNAGRFYVYDYLERTTTSKDNGKDSDFLPFNSIYVNNPEGYAPDPDNAAGGRTTYTFDSTDQNAGMAGSNFWFGMTTDIRFYLPNQPGTRDGSGYGNQSLYGQDMEFRFSGDDDVFVLVDNQLVLDIGGMHDIKSGTINFSTGIVTVEGSEQTTRTTYVRSLQPGEHTLTLLYMERGSSMSNCSIYFNISPRFTLSLQKEDFLTNAMLNGAEFQVFMDENCTIPATLWSSYQAYRQNSNQTTNTFKVANGKSTIWGFAAGNTYYIKETKPPDNQGYVVPNGLIRMELNNKGVASYTALVIPHPGTVAGADNPSPGFTVEGFRIDEENHVAYLIVSNSSQQGETTQVLVQKRWEGQQTTPVTVYLLADGQRIREIVLSDENNWQHVWENLPKFRTASETEEDASPQTEINYTVEESTVPGYIGTVEAITQSSVTTAAWEQVEKLAAQQTYLLQSPAGCLSTDGSGKLNWISLEAAKTSDGAQWHVESRSGDYVTLKNDAGFYLAYHDSYVPSEMYFYATTQQNSVKFDDNLESYGESPRIYANDNARYLLTTIDSRGYVLADYNGWHQNSAWLTLHRKIGGETSVPITGLGYKITNRPVSAEDLTSLKVTKRWVQRDGETAFGDTSQYQELSVPIKLQSKVGAGAFADTGQTAMLNFRSGWTYTFSNLPKKDAQGNEIAYTVVEDWQSKYWQPQYSAVTKNPDGSFAVEVKNVYSYRADIPVEKHWDPFIHDMEKVPVQIHLYSAVEDDMQATWLETITVSQENQWKCVFEVIPPEEAGVNYYIYEPTGQFIPYYSNPARIFIGDESRRVSRVTFDTGTGTAETTLVTNRPVVELPKTGGFGTDGLMAGGLLLAAAAWILLRVKRGKEWLHTL